MADLANALLRMTVRAFYPPEHTLVVDALILHSTLSDEDLARVVCMTPKYLRKICGKLKEDGLLSIHSRLERRADGSSVVQFGSQAGKERMTNRDWYYLQYHRAIDSIKYRIYKLNKHVESKGASTVEKKDFECHQCGSKWTALEAMDNFDMSRDAFLCNRCQSVLVPSGESEQTNENESMKRLNQDLAKLLALMQQIDASTVPENDFQMALSNQKPIERTESHPGANKEIVDGPNNGLQSTKGLEIQPEKIAVQVQDDEDVKRETAAAEAAARREKEARQNALPEWIAKSTVSGDITAIGAKEEQLRRERMSDALVTKDDEDEDRKTATGDEDVMAAYWEELAQAREKEAAEAREEDEEDDEEEVDDDFEDVDVPVVNSGGNVDSSNATDDERDAKRVKVDESAAKVAALPNGDSKDTPASDEDEDLEFEEV